MVKAASAYTQDISIVALALLLIFLIHILAFSNLLLVKAWFTISITKLIANIKVGLLCFCVK